MTSIDYLFAAQTKTKYSLDEFGTIILIQFNLHNKLFKLNWWLLTLTTMHKSTTFF